MSVLPGLTRPWEIYLVHHTHVDIGYTEPQQVVFRKHADFIAQALDYCTATDDLPPGERFVWTCEVSWTVKAFLARYPERAEEFFRRVREGRIEVAGIYLQLTDLFGEDLLKRALEYACDLSKQHGFDVVTAMNDDVNGWAWGLPRMMAEQGIKYFDTAINETRALGVRPRPSPFYWASPDSGRVLMWHGGGYLTGNLWGLDKPGAEKQVTECLKKLEDESYPHNAVEVRIHGELHDNAPPGLWICDAVQEWNARWEFPKMRLCTARTWFEHVESHWPEPIRELRAGWPDWWADGNGSALYESSLVRKAQADIATAEAAYRAGGTLDRSRLDAAAEAAMFFAEHTWGAWCSTDAPDSLESRAQWNAKAGFAYTAAVEAETLVNEAVRSLVREPIGGPEVHVFNPLPFVRTDVVELTVADYVVGADPTAQVCDRQRPDDGSPFHLVDMETGQKVPVARSPVLVDSFRRPGQSVRFIARDVPALGTKRYRIVPELLNTTPTAGASELALENACFRLSIDPRTGGIGSLIDKATGLDLVAKGEYTLNQHIYEIIDSPEGREALCEWGKLRYDTPFRRGTPEMHISPGRPVPFGASLVVEGGGGDVPFVRSEIVLYDDLPRVDLLNSVTKLPIDCSDSIYHAFPLVFESPVIYLDVPGAIMRPGIDQVPGTATDWHSIQDYFAVSSGKQTVTVVSPDVPLVQVNGINTGCWQQALPPHNGLVMSWVMNNYWFTNFPAVQGGTVHYRYSLSSYARPFERQESARFARCIRQPLVGLVFP